ncbi:MAG TPA: hypothetical protein PLK94_09055 [Alphaproteobacteria bacterium]|nr:hypothetical protein [Alphaproteobacteria bacterium]HOO51419.1 hypothetical protein [Alphaproteobacteria bacterium]
MTKTTSDEIREFLKSVNKDRELSEANVKEDRAEKIETIEKQGWLPRLNRAVFDNSAMKKINEVFRAAERFNKMYDYAADFLKMVGKYTGPVGWLIKEGFCAAGKYLKFISFEREIKKYGEDGSLNPTLRGKMYRIIKGEEALENSSDPRHFKRDYKRDGDGDLIFDKKRLAMSLALTAAFTAAVTPTAMTLRDAYHLATAQEQTLYFSKPTFNSVREIYQVTACKSKTECEGGDNALIFDIPDNNALDIFYTITRGKGYDPEHEIVSAFTSEYHQCTVTAKGDKPIILNYYFGSYRWHPKVIDHAVCTPVVNMN